MVNPASPIAVLDSGLGGLTVVRELQRQSPAENILYFGDTARVPYGTKSPQTVTGFVREIIIYLQRHRPKHVVIACNTATAVALDAIKAEFPHLPITGVIEPGARAAIDAAGGKPVPKIAVIATEATVRSKAYERAIFRRRQHARLFIFPTPLLVPIIEDGRGEGRSDCRSGIEAISSAAAGETIGCAGAGVYALSDLQRADRPHDGMPGD